MRHFCFQLLHSFTYVSADAAAEAVAEAEPCRPRYRTGTGPFMALEVLRDYPAPLQQYRHELESFFYLLSYFCATFDPINHTFHRLGLWEHHDLKIIAAVKREFLMEDEDDNMPLFEAHAHADYRALVAPWIRPLRTLFAEYYSEKQSISVLIRTLRVKRSRGTVSSRRLQEDEDAIEARKKRWIKIITYESFMECLQLLAHLPGDPECPGCSC